MKRVLTLLVVLLPLFQSGCMYHIEHRLPVDATFGPVSEEFASRTRFERSETRRYLLGGLVPWPSLPLFDNDEADAKPGREIERLEIATQFGPIDMLLKLVPYASYVLAQRSVQMKGIFVDPLLEESIAQLEDDPEDAASPEGLAPESDPADLAAEDANPDSVPEPAIEILPASLDY